MKFSDLHLKRKCWATLDEIVTNSKLFDRNIDVFILACAIGVCEDKFLEEDEEDYMIDEKSIGRNTLQNNYDIQDYLIFLYQNAVLNTQNLNLTVEQRKEAAFNFEEEQKIIGMSFEALLVKFADYGMTVLNERITNHTIESLSNIIDLIDNYKNNLDLICDPDIDIDEEFLK